MKSRGILKFTFLGIFLILQVVLLFFKNFEVLDYSRYINEYPLPLSGKNREVNQEFKTPGPLARIDIMLANYKIKPKDGTLRLSIFKGDKQLFLENYPARTVEDNRFYTFPIDANKVPAGHYRLRLDYFPGDKKERLAVWTSKKNSYPFGGFYVNHKQRPGDMTFRVYYCSTIWKERQRWLSPDSGSAPGFRGYALAGGFLLLVFMVNFLFYYFTGKLIGQVGH